MKALLASRFSEVITGFSIGAHLPMLEEEEIGRFLPFTIALLFRQSVLVDSPFPILEGLPTRQRWHPIHKHILGHILGRLFQKLGQPDRLSFLLRRHELLLPSLANEIHLGLGLAAHRQQ